MDYSINLEWQKSHPDMKLEYNLDYDRHSIWEIPALGREVSELPFYVQETGLTIAYEDYYVYRENLDSYLLTFTRAGSLTFECEGQVYPAPAGTLCWLDCRKPHAYYTTRGAHKVEVYFIHMHGDGADKYTRFFTRTNGGACVNLQDTSGVDNYFKTILNLYRPGSHTELTDYSACSLLSMLCLSVIEQSQQRQAQAVPGYINQIKAYLDTHFAEPVTLEALSQAFFLSKSYIQKRFKQYIGLSPAAYLLQLRVSQAKKLLRTTVSPVGLIGVQVGMPDPSYFVHTFRRAEGITPLEYRRMWSYR